MKALNSQAGFKAGPQGAAAGPGLSRELGLFHATMVVMGGIVGAGIFINPSVVARQVHTPALILGVWLLGGMIALAGAFVYAELADRLPLVGGDYAYLREAFHPLLAFLNGWALLLVMQTGGMAAVAVTFAQYFVILTGGPPGVDRFVAVGALAVLTAVNCTGVQAGSTVQSTLMVTKILAIAALVLCGLFLAHPVAPAPNALRQPAPVDPLTSIGAAMIPVLFAYGGWQTVNFIAGEVREPRKNLPRALILGVSGVIVLYLAVNYVCVRVLGPEALAATLAPASEVMRLALRHLGEILIAFGIAISTLGFLSQNILTAPRVYFAMAADGLFFRSVARVSPETHAPVVAILLQGALASVVALSGRYEQILNYVTSVDWIFFGLGGICLFVFRRREALGSTRPGSGLPGGFRVPGHPITTAFFVLACALVVLNTIYKFPVNSAIGLALLAAGVPVYFLWRNSRAVATERP